MNHDYDEISLRDLYLIIKRGLPLILVVSLLAAAGALLFVTLRTDRYQAEATVLVSPTPVKIKGGEDARNLVLDQRYDISWETYQKIAFSRSVLQETLARFDDPSGLTVARLSGNGEITRLSSGQQGSLTILHSFTHPDPEVAAMAASSWAAAAAEAAGTAVLASLDSLRSATQTQLETLEERVAEAAQRWEEFNSQDRSSLLDARLAGLAQRIPRTEATLEGIDREIAAIDGTRQALAGTTSEARTSEGQDARAATALLEGRDILPPETIQRLRALLEPGDGEADLVTLIRQVEMQRLTAELAGLLAKRGATEEQLERLREEAAELREGQAGLTLERERLEQRLKLARAAYGELAYLAPVIDYIHQIAPANSRVLNEASVPAAPLGPNRFLVVVLAAVAGAMLALLFVFLRAAVSEPAAVPPGEPAPAPAH